MEKHCKTALVITRNRESADVLGRLGVPTALGTDTAWTFEAAPRAQAEKLLYRAGWDGTKDVLAICPINPFWWPVRPEPLKAVLHGIGGGFSDAHYKSIYFHNDAPEVEQRFSAYLRGLAGAIKDFTRKRDYFPILVGMEQLDRRACERLNELLGGDVPLFVSDEHDMYRDGVGAPPLLDDRELALPRHRLLDAGARSVGGRDHGRADPQPHGGSRAAGAGAGGRRPGPRRGAPRRDGEGGARAGGRLREHRPLRRLEPRAHGRHGPRARRARARLPPGLPVRRGARRGRRSLRAPAPRSVPPRSRWRSAGPEGR
ncbi:MAG: hypothetical protein M5U28_21020 [Sandaracinaceae bacterium]|nr:hypothetical protein [Sandaracinaceae bacterium]